MMYDGAVKKASVHGASEQMVSSIIADMFESGGADEYLKNLKDENENLKAEIAELKKAGTKQPAAGAQDEQGAGKNTDDLTAHSVVTPDMSLAEMRKALEEREALLRNH